MSGRIARLSAGLGGLYMLDAYEEPALGELAKRLSGRLLGRDLVLTSYDEARPEELKTAAVRLEAEVALRKRDGSAYMIFPFPIWVGVPLAVLLHGRKPYRPQLEVARNILYIRYWHRVGDRPLVRLYSVAGLSVSG